MTRVVNLRKEPYEIYIGRPGKNTPNARLGNPCAIGQRCPECSEIHWDGGSTLPCYKKYLWRRINTDPEFKAAILSLEGKVLGCFCDNPKRCHGGVIIQYLEWYKTSDKSEDGADEKT